MDLDDPDEAENIEPNSINFKPIKASPNLLIDD